MKNSQYDPTKNPNVLLFKFGIAHGEKIGLRVISREKTKLFNNLSDSELDLPEGQSLRLHPPHIVH